MKKKIYIVIVIALLTGILPKVSFEATAQVSVSFQVFYDQLSPYGEWVSYPDYGYVWVPTAVPRGFRPYATRGHWVYTPDGWTWVSGYNWGWATFHYGNWFYDESYGWMWSPGYDWAPAWVTWGEYGDDYCWAPISPRVSIGVSFTSYRPPVYYWNFVPRRHITNVNINNYYVTRVNNTTIVNNITVINNGNSSGSRAGHAAYIRGPEPRNVQKYTHTAITPVTIRDASRPGGGNIQQGQLALYRPVVNKNTNARPAPSKVQDLHALKPDVLPANAHIKPVTPERTRATKEINSPGNTPALKPGNKPSSPVNRSLPNNPVTRPAPPINKPSPNVKPVAKPNTVNDRGQNTIPAKPVPNDKRFMPKPHSARPVPGQRAANTTPVIPPNRNVQPQQHPASRSSPDNHVNNQDHRQLPQPKPVMQQPAPNRRPPGQPPNKPTPKPNDHDHQ